MGSLYSYGYSDATLMPSADSGSPVELQILDANGNVMPKEGSHRSVDEGSDGGDSD